MNIACPNPANGCVDPASPVSNYSAETDDGPRFYGRNYGTGLVPPLGSLWLAPSCVGICTSTVSQEDADACAQRANIECLPWPEPGPDGNPVPRAIFLNDAQSCDSECADGLLFTYTIPAGTFAAFSQAEADAIAHSTACNRAISRRICMSAISPEAACAGQAYSGVITATGLEVPLTGNAWAIVSGSLPTGLSLSSTGNNQATISGMAGVEQSSLFTVRMTTPDGDFMQKSYRLCVIGKTTLDDGAVGTAYSETLTDLTSVGCPDAFPLSWQVTAGALPDGLVLDEATGVISGSPTVAGTFVFTVLMQSQAS